MAFEVLNSRKAGIPRGTVALGLRGMARFNRADLAAVGIANRATILIDQDEGRLALRAPLECEPGLEVGAEEGAKSRTVWLAGALNALGIDPQGAQGWVDCAVVEDRIEVRLRRESGRRK